MFFQEVISYRGGAGDIIVAVLAVKDASAISSLRLVIFTWARMLPSGNGSLLSNSWWVFSKGLVSNPNEFIWTKRVWPKCDFGPNTFGPNAKEYETSGQ